VGDSLPGRERRVLTSRKVAFFHPVRSGRIVGDPEITPVLPLWSYFRIGGHSTAIRKTI
jgi:hypothetical protein